MFRKLPSTLLFVALLACPSLGGVGPSSPIKHVIVLMMENRSFDHLLGFLKEAMPELDGLNGDESNPESVSNPNSPRITVNKHGYDIGPDDPEHTFGPTTEQIFGTTNPSPTATPEMDGFVQNAIEVGHSKLNPMSMFTKATDSAPIINQLAQEFAVFDQWFCSVPGPTDPNRGFATSGTSTGLVTNFNGTLWGQQSYFDYLGQNNVTWRAYYQDDPWAIMYYKDMWTSRNTQFVHELDQFFADVAAGDLPQFTWLQPRMTSHGGLPTWQHPDASVREGERLIKSVYEALRNSTLWDEVAFVLTYDEHGGFFDHAGPPSRGVPPPSPTALQESGGVFAFDRLGIRVPTLLVSPWVARQIVHQPSGRGSSRPTPSSQFEATSVMATVSELFGVTAPPLSDRVAWAGRFTDMLTTGALSAPRTDCPLTLATLPPLDGPVALAAQRAKPLNDHMEIQVEFYCRHGGHDSACVDRHSTNQGTASDFIVREAEAFLARAKGGAVSPVSADYTTQL